MSPATEQNFKWRIERKTISTSELKALLDRNGQITLVNTLGPDHFENTKIPGAVNISQDSDDFVASVEKQAGGKDKPVVVYCASQQCDSSEKAAEKLENAGFTDVSDYSGGFEAWKAEATEVAGAASGS